MLESIKDHMDTIIVADGAYELYYETYKLYNRYAKPWSTDGSLEIIRGFKGLPDLKLMHCIDEKPWKNQCEKRTALINAVPEGDWFLIIDADVMLKGDVDEGLEDIYNSGCVVGRVPACNLGFDADRLWTFWHPCVFQKMKGMHYYGTHWHLRDKYNRIIENNYPMKWTDRFVLVHFKGFKQPDRVLPHYDYMRQVSKQGWVEPKLIEMKH